LKIKAAATLEKDPEDEVADSRQHIAGLIYKHIFE